MMKALTVTELGKPVTLVDVPIPEPKENEVLVKMKVASSKPARNTVLQNSLN
jgi:NADPH:quinone reductase-like Zn-dependent oxidoreductase